MKGMAYGKAHREEMVSLLMAKWKLDRERASRTWELTARTWAERGTASNSAVLLSVQAAQELIKEKREIPLNQVVDFSFAKQAFDELGQK